ncbi:sensor histidine kinase [Streptomyces bullii]|uniref:Oxygen sensor histidine kinase NreB n=1 Tax=Streptomyces bullii TaxID=349910 RepID=A0ABW0V0J6_9ACTN
MPTSSWSALRSTPSARHLPHLAFLLVAVGTLMRLITVNSALCWMVAPPTVLLVVLYVGGLTRWERLGARGSRTWFALVLLLWFWVLWALPSALAPWYGWLAVPLAVVAQRLPGRRTSLLAIAVITVLLMASLTRISGGPDPEVLGPPIAAVWATVALYRTQQRLTRELAETRGELARRQREAGRLAERARIARDLHDCLAQELAGSRMLLQAAVRDWDRRPDVARMQMRAVVQALGAHLTETRSIIGDLTPPALADNDLGAALRDLCARTQSAAGAGHITFRTEGEPVSLSTDQAKALLRAAQTLLANACEHAYAAHIRVTLSYANDETASVEVADDGAGFDPTAPARAKGRGFGLSGARDRLHEVSGTLTVDSAPGHGTRGRATVPLRTRVMAGTP